MNDEWPWNSVLTLWNPGRKVYSIVFKRHSVRLPTTPQLLRRFSICGAWFFRRMMFCCGFSSVFYLPAKVFFVLQQETMADLASKNSSAFQRTFLFPYGPAFFSRIRFCHPICYNMSTLQKKNCCRRCFSLCSEPPWSHYGSISIKLRMSVRTNIFAWERAARSKEKKVLAHAGSEVKYFR